MDKRNSCDIISAYLPPCLRQAVRCVPTEKCIDLNEIRIRIGRPVCFVYPDRTMFLCKDGSLINVPSDSRIILPDKRVSEEIVNLLCRFSVHSFSREFSQGFFTIENGIRVGVTGIYAQTSGHPLKFISSFNFRISREVHGCADEVFHKLFKGSAVSVIICGEVNSGKTTYLRDLCRLCGNTFKTALIDERGELAASSGGIPTNDIGIQTDVLDGCKRSDGIISAIRSLSPKMIFCDEISNAEDSEAVMQGVGCGVKFAASVHAGSFSNLMRRSVIHELINAGAFEYAVILEGESFPGKVREVRRLKNDA